MPFVGITAIKYGDSQDVQNNYGAGRHPVSRSKGRITPSASITLYKSEVVALQRQAPNGRLQDIAPFDITVSYLPESGIISTDKIRNCQFTENKVDWKEGDLNQQIELVLIPSHIEWGQPESLTHKNRFLYGKQAAEGAGRTACRVPFSTEASRRKFSRHGDRPTAASCRRHLRRHGRGTPHRLFPSSVDGHHVGRQRREPTG